MGTQAGRPPRKPHGLTGIVRRIRGQRCCILSPTQLGVAWRLAPKAVPRQGTDPAHWDGGISSAYLAPSLPRRRQQKGLTTSRSVAMILFHPHIPGYAWSVTRRARFVNVVYRIRRSSGPHPWARSASTSCYLAYLTSVNWATLARDHRGSGGSRRAMVSSCVHMQLVHRYGSLQL